MDDLPERALAALEKHGGWYGVLRALDDAERYRWLRAIDDNAPLDASGYPSLTQWKHVVSDRAGRLLFGKELDAVIDAAKREQGANAELCGSPKRSAGPSERAPG